MGVTIQEYRCRIGIFLPKFSKTKCTNILSKNKNESSVQFSLQQLLSLILATLIPFTVAFLQYPSINHSNQSYNHPIYPTIQGIYTPAKNFSMNLVKSSIINQYSIFTELTNFYSRCTNGNRQAMGIKIAHFNKGSGHLATKKHEIESAMLVLIPIYLVFRKQTCTRTMIYRMSKLLTTISIPVQPYPTLFLVTAE